MFRIIAIETFPAYEEFDNETRYESTMRLLKADRGLVRRFVLCRDYRFEKDQLVKDDSILPEDFHLITREVIGNGEKKEYKVHVNLCAIVGKNGSGKSSLIELILRLLNNTAYALRAGIDNNGSYQLHFVDSIFARMYMERPDGKIVCIEQNDRNLKLSKSGDSNLLFNYHYLGGEQEGPFAKRKKLEESDCKQLLSSLFYTIMVDYSAYGFNIDNYRAEWIEREKEDIKSDRKLSDEERCWIGSLFHKNDAYQTPIVINPFRTRGNIDYNRERGLLNERLFLLLMDNDKVISGILDNKAPYSFIFSKEAEYLPETNDGSKFSCKKIVDVLGEYGIDETGEKLDEISRNIIGYWERCLGFRLVEDIDKLDVEKTKDQDKISALNYLVYKTIKSAYNYSQYHAYQSSIGSNKDLDKLVKSLYCDDTHITLKLRRAIALLIFGHYGTDMILGSDEMNVSEIRLEKFKKGMADSLVEQKERIEKLRTLWPVENPYTYKDFEALELKPRGDWKREELLPSPSLFTALKLKLEDGSFLLFDTLSSGEKQIIYTLGTTVYQLHHLNSVDSKKIQYPCVNIIFDEIELYYHPAYQKGLIKRMLNVIENMELGTVEHINMIFATHSPFILSDIPRDRILYLKEGNDVSDEVEVNPFGANINDVLCQSFFLDKGFMGDYIQGRLVDLIDYMTNPKRTNDTYWRKNAEKLIMAIGDPLLRDQLTDLYLNMRFGKSKRAMIEWLKRKIEELEN